MVACCPLQGSDDGGPELSTTTHPLARKDHSCVECNSTIPKGAKHEVIKGLWEGRWDSYRTCLMCVEIRDHFACEGWMFGQIWNDIEQNFFPDMVCGGPCMDGLSPAAKLHLVEARLEWLLDRGQDDDNDKPDWEDWPKNRDLQRSHPAVTDSNSARVKNSWELQRQTDWEAYCIERERDLRYAYGRAHAWESVPKWHR